MRVFIAGQKAFGRAVFEAIAADGHKIVGVCAPPFSSRSATDGTRFPDRLREVAERAGVAWLPSGQLRADTLPAGVDLIIAAHAHDFIGRKTRLAARLGAIGYHPSLLPRHRGRDAVRWAIHMGEVVTGGTVYWLSDGVDAGPIAAQDWCWIRPGDAAGELWQRELFPLGRTTGAPGGGRPGAGRHRAHRSGRGPCDL